MEWEQEEMQFLGICGIYRESYRIILARRKLFSQITLSLILPLSLIFLAHIQLSDLLFSNIIATQTKLDNTRGGTALYGHLSDLISSEWAYFWLFKAIYFTFLLVFSLLSTSAVVYAVACIYARREVPFNKLLRVVVPKVWKRLMLTFLTTFVLVFAYNVVAVLVLLALRFAVPNNKRVRSFAVLIAVGFYLAGLVYLSIIWHLASVVSVLEQDCGVRAMAKSKGLIKGKMWVALVVFFKLTLLGGAVQFCYMVWVVHGGERRVGVGGRVIFGVVCFLVLFKLVLFGLVIQTVIYFVCKSYHHENIDKSALSDHLEVYLLAEYVPLKSKDVQLEQFQA